jgi:hypothetical protein
MFHEDSADSNTADINTADSNTNTSELAQFRAWRDSRLRESALAEGRQQASAEAQAAERQADADAIRVLAAKQLSLRDCFGNSATQRGRDALTILHRSSFSTRSGVYSRLRRMAADEGLVR